MDPPLVAEAGAAPSCGGRCLRTVASLVERRLQHMRACVAVFPGLSSLARGLSCTEACGVSPDQGLNLRLLQRQADSFPPGHRGLLTLEYFFYYFTFYSLFCLVYILSFWKFYYIGLFSDS